MGLRFRVCLMVLLLGIGLRGDIVGWGFDHVQAARLSWCVHTGFLVYECTVYETLIYHARLRATHLQEVSTR
jgi:hypothetical protein